MENRRIIDTDFKKLIGKWKTEGTILKTSENPEMKISGTDNYEIILDGFFILHIADVLMGDVKSQTYEMIGWDERSDAATLEHYNNEGSSGTMTATLINDKLNIHGDGLRFKGRFTNANNVIAGVWEKSTDNKNWCQYLEMKFTKIESED